jgi:hypothetical protein
MMIQLTVFVPALIAIYAATGAWVFSSTPSPKPSTLFGEDFYTLGSALCSCARGFSFFLIDCGINPRSSRLPKPIDMSKWGREKGWSFRARSEKN